MFVYERCCGAGGFCFQAVKLAGLPVPCELACLMRQRGRFACSVVTSAAPGVCWTVSLQSKCAIFLQPPMVPISRCLFSGWEVGLGGLF